MRSRVRIQGNPLRAILVLVASYTACEAPRTPEEFRALTADAVARIGGTAQDLVPIAWLAASEKAAIAVAQSQDGSVLLFDSSGIATARVGRPGEGPGEFREISAGGWLRDSLWVFDGGLRRVSLMSSTGDFARSFTFPGIDTTRVDRSRYPAFRSYSPVGLLPGDTLIALTPPAGGRAGGSIDVARSTILLLTRDGEIGKVLGQLAPDRGRVEIVAEGFSPGSVMRTPFYAVPLWAASGIARRIVLAVTRFDTDRSGEYRVTAVRTSGDTAFARSFSFTSEPIPSTTIDSALARLFPPTYAGAASLRAQLHLPASYPPLDRVLLGSDGSTWIGLRPKAGLRPWIVLDSSGAVVGRVDLGVGDQLRAATLTRIWSTRRNEEGIESILRYVVR